GRRRGPAAGPGLAGEAGGAAIGGGSGSAAPLARDRRPRRRLGAVTSAPAGAGAGSTRPSRPAVRFRLTLAPISPSAHRAPSVVCTSMRQTTIEEGAPPTGGRFWVSVQRA